MYSEYGALGVDCRMLADLRQCQMVRQTQATMGDWLRVLPASRSQLAGDWRASVGEIQKWRSIGETTPCQPPNLVDAVGSSSPHWNPRCRRPESTDGGSKDRAAAAERAAVERRRAVVANPRRRFDFRRLAESATRRDDDESSADEITPTNDAVKHDHDQSDRRLFLRPEDADKRLLLWSLPRHSTLPPLKSVLNPVASFDGYISSASFDDKITLRQCNEPISN